MKRHLYNFLPPLWDACNFYESISGPKRLLRCQQETGMRNGHNPECVAVESSGCFVFFKNEKV